MRIIPCIQRSPEWWEARRGVPTASGFDRILTSVTARPSAGQEGYIAELISDTICQNPNFFTERPGNTEAMRNGESCEPDARRFYEVERNVEVQEVGFIMDDQGRFGCSPDGLVPADHGGLELKVPLAKTQVEYLLEGTLPIAYKQQCHGCLIVTGAKYWDFLSYHPGLSPLLLRVEPDDYTEALRAELENFWVKYQAAKAKLLKPSSRPQENAPQADPFGPGSMTQREADPFQHDPGVHLADDAAHIIGLWNQWLDMIDRISADEGRVKALQVMNAGLVDLGSIPDGQTKREAWNLILAFVEVRGWVWKKELKQFEAKP